MASAGSPDTAAAASGASGVPVMQVRDVAVVHRSGAGEVRALDGVSLEVWPGTSTAIVGRSGAGKSTLISVLALLRRPTDGQVVIDGRAAESLDDRDLSRLRGQSVGTVFQSFHLDPSVSAVDNVLLPAYFQRGSLRRARARARELLDRLGIGELSQRHPGQMSGGQRQRVAIARALFADPAVLLADEPTGNLDEETGDLVARDLMALAETGTAVVVVTHDPAVAAMASSTRQLVAGRFVT